MAGGHPTVGLYLSGLVVAGRSRRTIERRRWSLGLWAGHLERAGLALEAATVWDVEAFLARWPAAQSRQSIRSDLVQLHRWMVRRGLASENPVELVDAPRVPSRAATPIQPDDVVRAIASAPAPVRLMVMLMAYAGLRCSEVAALRAEDVDVPGRLIVVRSGKGGDDATVPMADELAAELERWPSRGRLFPGVKGNGVGARIRRLFRRLDIEGRPHDLRHSFGTMAAVRSSGDMKLVQDLMRHKAITTTSRYVRYHPRGHDVVNGMYGDAAGVVPAAS